VDTLVGYQNEENVIKK